MARLRFTLGPALLLAAGLALATLSQGSSARADDGDLSARGRNAEREKDKDRDKDKDADKDKDLGAAVELRYPPFSTRLKVLTAGVVVAGTAWGIAFGAARGWPETTCVIGVTGPVTPGSAGTPNPIPCVSGPPGSAQLGIPIVGPWIALGKSGCPSDYPNCSVSVPVARGFGYVIDGVVQLAGIGLIVEAIVMKTESGSAEPAKKKDSGVTLSGLTLRYRGVEMTPVPGAGPSATGLSIVGTF
jgi:hypothetical protein